MNFEAQQSMDPLELQQLRQRKMSSNNSLKGTRLTGKFPLNATCVRTTLAHIATIVKLENLILTIFAHFYRSSQSSSQATSFKTDQINKKLDFDVEATKRTLQSNLDRVMEDQEENKMTQPD